MTKELLTIQEVARKLGVSTKTLRRWEEKGVIVPHRTIGNQRRYSLDHLDELKQKLKIKSSSTGKTNC